MESASYYSTNRLIDEAKTKGIKPLPALIFQCGVITQRDYIESSKASRIADLSAVHIPIRS